MDEAEDVVQGLFVDIWEKRSSLNINQSVKQYFYKAVYFRCINAQEHKQVRKKYAEQEAFFPAGNSPTEQDGEEKRLAIQKALEKLPEKCKQVFVLSRFEEMKYVEIADKMGISKNTVENHMGKALRLLRAELKHLI